MPSGPAARFAPVEVPLVTASAVARGGYLSRLSAAAQLLARDVLGGGEAPVENDGQ